MDGTRLVDDGLSLDFLDMGTFLISKVNGVRITENPRSDTLYDQLEFRGLVRGWQPEERQKWIAQLLGDKEHQRDGRDEDLMERLWLVRNVHPILVPTRWCPRMLGPMTLPRVGEEMLGFNTEAQGWIPCKMVG